MSEGKYDNVELQEFLRSEPLLNPFNPGAGIHVVHAIEMFSLGPEYRYGAAIWAEQAGQRVEYSLRLCNVGVCQG